MELVKAKGQNGHQTVEIKSVKTHGWTVNASVSQQFW